MQDDYLKVFFHYNEKEVIELVKQGLGHKGFEFENDGELKKFIKDRCGLRTTSDFVIHFLVDSEEFLAIRAYDPNIHLFRNPGDSYRYFTHRFPGDTERAIENIKQILKDTKWI
jgi:hypothetical protein